MRLPSDILVQLGQVGTLILGSLGVWVAMFNQRRQLNGQIFVEISRRFQDLLRMFPTEAWLANRNPSAPLPPPSQEITDCTLYCIQLIADVYHLRRGGYISKRLWSAWEREIRHILEVLLSIGLNCRQRLNNAQARQSWTRGMSTFWIDRALNF
jgi:ABC-type phosphate/phosphonate transport system permease subunit